MDTSNKSRLTRIGIVVIAAILVEIITIIQYQHLKSMMLEEMGIRSRVVLHAMSQEIQHTLELTERTLRENLREVKRSMAHPDSIYTAMVHLIDDNPNVVGGCLAVTPDYYPSKGHLYEPFASKQKDGSIVVSQIAGPDHDYTQNEEYVWVVEHQTPSWTDPYVYGPDSLSYATYSYPIKDGKGRIVAVCGLDIDLSWLGDTLNARQPFPSSFGMLLTREGVFVAGPSENRIPRADVLQAVDILNGKLPASANPSISFRTTSLEKDPYWQLVQVYRHDEVYSRMRKMRLQQLMLILLGLAILAFMINRYARNEKKLRKASEEQARISGELAVARRIQSEMLPKSFPSFVYGSLEPAREVGGDLYDFYERDGKLFFCIGDVSGKGVPSAMLMSMAHSLFRTEGRKIDSPSRILTSLNQTLCQGNDSNMFITFFIGCLDLYSGELNYASAGHDKPFIITDQAVLLPAKSNLPLGVFPTTRFEEQNCILEPGTTLLLYTDGLTEAKNPARKAFGREGTLKVLNDFRLSGKQSLETLVTSLSEAAHHFAGEAPQSDDLTMLAVRFAPENILRDQITLYNDISEIARLSGFVKGFFDQFEIDKKTASGIRLAVEEAVVNVIDYAYSPEEKGEVLIQADTNLREVRFTITDSGYPFDPTAVLEPDTSLDVQHRPIGGLGILLSRKLTDSISYIRKDGKNVLSLTKTI